MPSLTPHPVFFYEDGNIYLKAESTCFKVHRGVLAKQSDTFGGLFQVPQPGQVPASSQVPQPSYISPSDKHDAPEGTEQNPFELPAVSLAQITLLLQAIYGGNPLLTVAGALCLLELATRFEMPCIADFAELQLKYRVMPPLLAAQYGLLLNRPLWTLCGFSELVTLPSYMLPADQSRLVTPAIFHQIAAMRNLCADYRYKVFSKVPAVVHDPKCKDKKACAVAWKGVWQDFGRTYLNPNPHTRIFYTDAAQKLDEILTGQSQESCFKRTKARMLDSDEDLFSREGEFAHRAIKEAANTPLVNLGHLLMDHEIYEQPPVLMTMYAPVSKDPEDSEDSDDMET